MSFLLPLDGGVQGVLNLLRVCVRAHARKFMCVCACVCVT